MSNLRKKKCQINSPIATGNRTDRALHCELLEDRRLLAATVLSTVPLAGTISASDADIAATFDSAISAPSVTDQTFVLHRQYGGQLLSLLGEITSLTSSGSQVTLNPAHDFSPGEVIQVTASEGLLDDLSIQVNPHVWEFRTAIARGSGTFVDSGLALGTKQGWLVALGDVDSDGDLDVFATNFGPSTIPDTEDNDTDLWINQGGLQGGMVGQFADSGQVLEFNRPHDVALGDLDGDGDLDAFMANSTGQANTIWVNQGGLQGGTEGQFADSGQRMGDSNSRGVALGDLDGDGDLDAVIANRKELPNRVWINQGGAQEGTAGQFEDSGQLLGSARSYDVKLGDVDGDGDLDAFVANRDIFGVPNRVWLNDGAATFSDSGQLLGASRSRSVSLGDLDGDGDLDAYVANRHANHVWLNQGGVQGGTAGQFVDSGQALGSSDSYEATLGDVDADGDLDAFVANRNSAANIVWINQGGVQGGAAGGFVDSGQRIGNSDSRGVALGDLDNDGDIDAFVTNRGEGQPNLVWLNQHGSADFDADGDIDGADFLTWQTGFGIASGAARAHGDSNDDGAVDDEDMDVWRRQLGTAEPFLADFNQDNDVDGGDFLILQRGFGATSAEIANGDSNRDRVVDGEDLGLWQSQYGTADLFQIADFDADSDVDGADFLTLQRGFGAHGANLAEGDSNGDRVVDRKDWNVWRLQYGTTEPPQLADSAGAERIATQANSAGPGGAAHVEDTVAADGIHRADGVARERLSGRSKSATESSWYSPGDQHTTNAGAIAANPPALLPLHTATKVWLPIAYLQPNVIDPFGPYRAGAIGSFGSANQHRIDALERLYPDVDAHGLSSSKILRLDQESNRPSVAMNAADPTEELNDAVLAEWEGCRTSNCEAAHPPGANQ